MDKPDQRASGIDLIKVLAIVSVIAGHFLLNTQYYAVDIDTPGMYFQTFLKWLVYTAVPLFVICTGYLNTKAEISGKHYKKLLRIVITYLFISVLCILYKQLVLNYGLTWRQVVLSFTSFTADSYAWYVNMYIGLFLLIPFVNLALPYLNGHKRQFQLLLLLLFLLVSVPPTYKQIMKMFPNENLLNIPDFWGGMAYPVLLYLIGAYIREFRPKANKLVLVGVIVLMAAAQSFFYILGRRVVRPWDIFFIMEYSSPMLLIESVCIVLLFYGIGVKNGRVKSALRKISAVTLEMYLFSFLVDSFVYARIDQSLPQEAIFAKYFLIVVPLNIIVCLVISLVYKFVYDRLAGLGSRKLQV
jgi:surface polysaccharide O-acyltransferase-like enzyme